MFWVIITKNLEYFNNFEIIWINSIYFLLKISRKGAGYNVTYFAFSESALKSRNK